LFLISPGGEIGRLATLRGWWQQCRASSNLVPGTFPKTFSMQIATLSKELMQRHLAFVTYIDSLSKETFLEEKNGKWAAAQQADHILRSIKPLVLAFTLPKFMPKLLFGKANRPSKSYDEVVASYQKKLKDGGKASGQFIPAKIDFTKKNFTLQQIMRVSENLSKKLNGFSEADLDQMILPHPILGKMTYREMLYFTLYHVNLHLDITQRNLK
jgi:hypothetical protein